MATVDEVIRAISEFHSIPRRKISPTSSLMYDLGIGGDDAVDMVEMLEREFCVDLSDFDLSRYFHGEAIIVFGEKEALTVEQLTEVISAKQAR